MASLLLVRAATFGSFQQQAGGSADVAATLKSWALLNGGRLLLSMGPWLLALQALSMLEASDERPRLR